MPAPAKERSWKIAARSVPRMAVLAIPFVGACHIDWTRGWLFIAMALLAFAVNLVMVRRKNPVC